MKYLTSSKDIFDVIAYPNINPSPKSNHEFLFDD
jgi:hypothetical protein